MGRTGLELNAVTPCPNNDLHNLPKSSAAESGAFWADGVMVSLPLDPDLQVVVACWAKLPEAIKSGLLAIANGSIDRLEPNG